MSQNTAISSQRLENLKSHRDILFIPCVAIFLLPTLHEHANHSSFHKTNNEATVKKKKTLSAEIWKIQKRNISCFQECSSKKLDYVNLTRRANEKQAER
jgi:hypothetical protein